MTEKEFGKVVTALCNGDSPVTVSGAFFEVVCYLEGYGKGMAVVKNFHSVFTPFLQWFSKNKLDIPIQWIAFRNLFSSDDEALEKLSTLYNEYVKCSASQN